MFSYLNFHFQGRKVKNIILSGIQRYRVPGIVLAFPFYGCLENC